MMEFLFRIKAKFSLSFIYILAEDVLLKTTKENAFGVMLRESP